MVKELYGLFKKYIYIYIYMIIGKYGCEMFEVKCLRKLIIYRYNLEVW